MTKQNSISGFDQEKNGTRYRADSATVAKTGFALKKPPGLPRGQSTNQPRAGNRAYMLPGLGAGVGHRTNETFS